MGFLEIFDSYLLAFSMSGFQMPSRLISNFKQLNGSNIVTTTFTIICIAYIPIPSNLDDAVFYQLLKKNEQYSLPDLHYAQVVIMEKFKIVEFDSVIEKHSCSCNPNTAYLPYENAHSVMLIRMSYMNIFTN